MDRQAKMNTNGKPKSDPNVVASFTGLAHDVVELAELQGQLLKLDAVASGRTMRGGIALLMVGIGLLLGCMPILWLIIAESLVEFAGWTRTPALGLSLLVGLVITGGVIALSWMKLQTVFSSFQRSQEELTRNVKWIKTALKHQTAPPRAERRTEFSIPS
jgi:hypothetical protein